MNKNGRTLLASYCGLGLLALIGTHGVLGSPRNARLTHTIVCQILTKPGKFNKKIVKFSAFVRSDMIEHTVLLDSSCESQGISLWIPAKLQSRSDFEGLHNALSRAGPSTTDRFRITGTFTGTFHYYPKRSGEKRLLEATSVEDLEIKDTAPASPPREVRAKKGAEERGQPELSDFSGV